MTARNPLLSLAAVAALMAAVGCGGGNGNPAEQDAGFTTMGMPGVPSPTRVGANLVFADVAVDGKTGGRLGVDTGAPIMLVDASKYPGLTFPNQTEVTTDITVGDLTIDGVSDRTDVVRQRHGPAELRRAARRQRDAPVHGALRLRPSRSRLPPGHAADGDGDRRRRDAGELRRTSRWRAAGSGASATAAWSPSPRRASRCQVEIDGVTHPFILDTGASETTVRASLFTTVTADGRAQLSGLPIMTVMGSSTASATRVSTLTAAGATVNDAVDHDDRRHADRRAGDGGPPPVDGLLGGNFLREFLVTIDYPRRRAAPAALHDAADRGRSSSASVSSWASRTARTATGSRASTRVPTRRPSS